jgi:hypothetical protein
MEDPPGSHNHKRRCCARDGTDPVLFFRGLATCISCTVRARLAVDQPGDEAAASPPNLKNPSPRNPTLVRRRHMRGCQPQPYRAVIGSRPGGPAVGGRLRCREREWTELVLAFRGDLTLRRNAHSVLTRTTCLGTGTSSSWAQASCGTRACLPPTGSGIVENMAKFQTLYGALGPV